MAYALSLHDVQVMECVRDSRLPWDCFPKIVDAIACVNNLIAHGFIEDVQGNYRLTDGGRAVLDARIQPC